MPRTRSPPFSPCLRPAPEGWHAHANPQRHKPGTVLSHVTGSAASGLPAIPSDGRTRRPVAGQVGGGPPLTRQRRFYPAGRQARL